MTRVVFLEQKGDVSDDEGAADHQEDAVPSTSAKETRTRQTGGYITCCIPRPFVTSGGTLGERDRE